ncbi:MAG: sulfite exporter TauE/SafE family protein [Planctomycetales bacterium]|nr:sulfite exporter TauE/SafE family protein [Planctomycetales bacterium]
MSFPVLFIIGLSAGLLGGLLGIGGSIVIIPALTFLYGENQHLYQAAAILCNFFVSASAVIAHWKAETFDRAVLKWLTPLAMAGILAGVALSNCSFFAGSNSYLLARAFGAFLVYVVVYNLRRLYLSWFGKIPVVHGSAAASPAHSLLSAFCGAATGLAAGLLGIGAGTVATPMQQFFLRVPLRQAMSNSAATIVCIAWLGGLYKNLTLPQHGLEIADSPNIAVWVIPGSIVGGYIGGHLMHILPKNLVRGAFILVCILAAIKLLTVTPSG